MELENEDCLPSSTIQQNSGVMFFAEKLLSVHAACFPLHTAVCVDRRMFKKITSEQQSEQF
jgi:hypothetical protein